ncbi:MAG: hydroxyethylthiazole kinase [Pseudomonadota bacterium]
MTASNAIRALAALRAKPPLVHCITNFVAMNFAANTVLAMGAAPAMVHATEEAGDFAAVAGALTINIGTLSPPWVDGMVAAIKGAQAAGKPWVLDPVGHFATPYRSRVAADLLLLQPTILRGNASEILAFSGAEAQGRGVDTGDSVDSAMAAAKAIAVQNRCVVAVTGGEDFLTDGLRSVFVRGGHPMMEQVTAMGCSLTAAMGAFVAVEPDPFEAALGALLLFAEAGEAAARTAAGPGSFAVNFLDQLALIQPEALSSEKVLAL